eukprot:COSAG02_NODE_36960_length_448_cov_0.879656_2_plen_27_part_01
MAGLDNSFLAAVSVATRPDPAFGVVDG